MATLKENKIDYELCNVSDLKENEMKVMTVNAFNKEYKILLVKYEDEFYAIGNKCSHYSLPLINSVLFRGRIRCFAHGACFDVKTGDIEDFPGNDCLPKYKVRVNKATNKVHLEATLEELELKFRIKNPKAKVEIKQNSEKFVIIGGGAAALECVETLREEGYSNCITLVSSESHAPYDRPKLSKTFDVEIDKILLRSESFYEENNIKFLKNHKVTKVDFDSRKVECENGNKIDYDKLVIATGLIPCKHKPVPGDNLKGIFTLRSYDDSRLIVNYVNECQYRKKGGKLSILLIGTSFTALESASYFTNKATVTIICRRTPFSSHFGQQVGEKVVKLHESKGVKFIINAKLDVIEFKSSSSDANCLGSAVMSDGSIIDADVCLVATGSNPATSFLNGSNISIDSSGYIVVDKYMKTNVDNVYAVGDLAKFPRSCVKVYNEENKNDLINVQHWQMSQMQGRVAAYSLIHHNNELKSIPFFWSLNYGKTVRFTGYNDKYDEIIFHDDATNAYKFAAFYILNNRVIGVCTCDWDPMCATVAELMYNDIVIQKDSIKSDPWGIKALMK